MKMKAFYVLIMTILFCTSIKAQNKHCQKFSSPKEYVIDSIKEQILKDTFRFKQEDIKVTATRKRNIIGYSRLYVVNNRYAYKLDILPSSEVIEFVEEFMRTGKVKSIYFSSEKYGAALFGPEGKNGIIYINLKKGIKFNPTVANLKTTNSKRGFGDNFSE